MRRRPGLPLISAARPIHSCAFATDRVCLFADLFREENVAPLQSTADSQGCVAPPSDNCERLRLLLSFGVSVCRACQDKNMLKQNQDEAERPSDIPPVPHRRFL